MATLRCMEAVPATNADRRGALAELEALHSAGRIDASELARRRAAIANAQTLSDLSVLVADHGRAPATGQDRANRTFGAVVVERLNNPLLGGSIRRFTVGLGTRRIVIMLIGLALAACVAVAIPWLGALSDGGPSTPELPGVDPPTTTAAADPRLLTAEGFTALRNDMREELGSTRYLSAVIYPDYASIEVPISGDPRHSRRLYYNGSFPNSSVESPRAAGSAPADLRDVDLAALTSTIGQAPTQLKVADVTSRYVIFDRRKGRSVMSVYVSNAAGESGYWTMDLKGRTITKLQNR